MVLYITLHSSSSRYNFFSRINIAEMVEICGDFLKINNRDETGWPTVQFQSWVMALSTSTDIFLFEDTEGEELERKEAIFKQC